MHCLELASCSRCQGTPDHPSHTASLCNRCFTDQKNSFRTTGYSGNNVMQREKQAKVQCNTHEATEFPSSRLLAVLIFRGFTRLTALQRINLYQIYIQHQSEHRQYQHQWPICRSLIARSEVECSKLKGLKKNCAKQMEHLWMICKSLTCSDAFRHQCLIAPMGTLYKSPKT